MVAEWAHVRMPPRGAEQQGAPERIVVDDYEQRSTRCRSRSSFMRPKVVLQPQLLQGMAEILRLVAGPLAHQFERGVHRAVAGLALAGNNLIVEDVLLYHEWLLDYLALLRGITVLFVGVRVPLSVLEARERERGDRTVGQARGHHETVHAHGLYDLELDTALSSPADCADRIKQRLEEGPAPSAFDHLRARFAERLAAAGGNQG